MIRKVRKLINNPNRFFFDYFAKRLGSNQSHHLLSETKKDNKASPYISPAYFKFNKKVHPWLQVAHTFNLRTGALTGHPDQSLLISSTIQLDVLVFIGWITHAMNNSLRIYTLGGAVAIDMHGLDLLNPRKIESIYKRIHNKTDYVIESLGTFDNNFSLHAFIFDEENGIITVRSKNAFIKKIKKESFNKAYPSTIDNFGQYEFGTPWPVDIVYTWVNNNDTDWVNLWNSTYPANPFDPDRYSSKDELLYSIRALTKFLPWFHKLYIVSNCKRPDWLKHNHKIEWVDHRDIFPNNEDLPTFNSHAIESCLHRIDGLNEKFIYLNDDMIINAPCYYHDFYDSSERSIAHLEPYGMILDDNEYDKNKDYLKPSINCNNLVKKFAPSYLSTKLHKHSPYALIKSTLTKIEDEFQEHFDSTRSNKIRAQDDINVTSFLYHHYSLANGLAVNGEFSYLIVRPSNIQNLEGNNIRKYKYLCFNDGDGSSKNNSYINKYFKLMNIIHPHKCHLEIEPNPWNEITVSKTIMAYHVRKHRIPEIRRKIGDAFVSLDNGDLGLWQNAKKSWLSYQKDANYHLVIQDDAVVCDNFYENLKKNISKIPDNSIQCLFFRFKSRKTHGELNRAAREGFSIGGFFYNRLQWATAVMSPTSIIDEMISFSDEIEDPRYKNTDDLRLSMYLNKIGKKVYYPLPSLIDQDSNCSSLIGHGSNEGRQASYFINGKNKF